MTNQHTTAHDDVAAYAQLNLALDRLIDAVRGKFSPEVDDVRAATVAAVTVAASGMEPQQITALLAVLLVQVARGQRP